ncbi:MAG TPA: hypothetical protein VLC46_19210 [Thermoanaerobaculia bacterium]|jgi:hypothetical protein|nr:hypothetical protein [Thermoanaerobaculia bacterium]
MRSKVAEWAREQLDREMLALTAAERIEIAFALGERDLLLYAEANNLTRDEALSRIRLERQNGRIYSRSKAGG